MVEACGAVVFDVSVAGGAEGEFVTSVAVGTGSTVGGKVGGTVGGKVGGIVGGKVGGMVGGKVGDTTIIIDVA